MNKSQPFWSSTPLKDMTPSQWESLCDGCGKCCVLRFVGEDSRIFHVSDVACKLLDTQTGACSDYANRTRRVKGCNRLTPDNVGPWLPSTCAYRLVQEGKPLFFWHHLISGSRDTVHEVGVGVRGRVVNQRPGIVPSRRIVEVDHGLA